eukprot:scaffold31391_cov75-Cyclotella_meneghiniana.AAC.4
MDGLPDEDRFTIFIFTTFTRLFGAITNKFFWLQIGKYIGLVDRSTNHFAMAFVYNSRLRFYYAVVNNKYRTVANNSFADAALLRFVSRCSGQPITLGLDVLGWSGHRNPS